MKDNFDDFLRKKFNEESVENDILSENVDKIINGMFNKRQKNKKILSVILPVLLMPTTVFAITYSVFNLSSVGIDDTCLNVAIENGYLEKVDVPYQEYGGLSVNIDKFLIDDINMVVSFSYKINIDNLKYVKNIYIQDLYIFDENNNILFNENNNGNVIAQTSGYSKVQKENNSLKNTFFAQSDNFPKSKKIFIEFDNVILNYGKSNTEIKGNWKFEINVTNNMVTRENINYKCISNNNYNKNITVKSMKLTNTGLIINAKASNNEILNKAKIEVIVDNKTIKANNNVFEKNLNDDKNKTEYIYTYNLTKYDAPNQIIVQIKYQNEKREMIFIKDEEK